MEINIHPAPASDRELLDLFISHPDLGRQRMLFSPYFGNAIWWIAHCPSAKYKDRLCLHPKTKDIWSDPRLDRLRCLPHLFLQLGAKHLQPSPLHLRCLQDNLISYCIPLFVDTRYLGILGISHLRPSQLKRPAMDLLNFTVRTLLAKVASEYELKRLSESVRPRAIALSTVHTVHRLINSTLNLDELLSHLARLTSQVLRTKTCSIFLYESNKKRHLLVEKAKVGFPLRLQRHLRSFAPGEGLEGRVLSTAKTVLRKHLISTPLIDQEVIGVITLTKKKDGKPFNAFDKEILTTLAEEAVVAVKNAQLYEEQKKVTLGAIQSMAAILDARFGHTRKLATDTLLKISLSIAQLLHLSEEEKQAIHYATLLRSASKVGLPDEIVKKPTRLTGEEYQIIRQHPIKGAKIMQSFESLKPVAPIILYSHEHYDGSGYPQGLKGSAIPMGARILALVNALDAILAGRPYKSRASLKEALEELKRHRGSQFDPKIIDAFQTIISKPHMAKLLGG